MVGNTTNIGISIPTEMFEWLEQPENKHRINRSQLFQDAVKNLMYPTPKKIPPMSILVILLGMSFGVGCILGAMALNFEYMFTISLYMLGFVILLASTVTIIKETRLQSRSR